MMRATRTLAPLLALVTGACFATRTDVRVLQGDIATLRTELAQRDSTRNVETAAAAAREGAALATITDSLRASNARLSRWQANVQLDLRAMQEQLLQIQELTGQSQRRIQELRADMESRSSQAAAPAVPTPPAAGGRDAAGRPQAQPPSPQPSAPGPNQLYQLAYDQLRRSSYGAARAGFQELLEQYPSFELASDAQFYIAEAYAAEGNASSADSVYALVVSRFPKSTRAATALYKHGLLLQRAGKTKEARDAFQRVVSEYPRSDEAELAREELRRSR